MDAISTSGLLSLKQVFVRYVSHEIRLVFSTIVVVLIANQFRSPLNVVHAGLELLLMDLQRSEFSAANRFRELVEDIFAASGSAITILNDLLNYEHIDSGKGKSFLDSFNKTLMIY